MKTYQLIVAKNQVGYWGQYVEFPCVLAHGSNIEAVTQDARAALELYFEECELTMHRFEIVLVMDLVHFFQVNDFINVTRLTSSTGMNSSLLHQYAQGIKYPRPKQVAYMERVVREIRAELLQTHLTDKQMPLNV